jgi:hypothetical protein
LLPCGVEYLPSDGSPTVVSVCSLVVQNRCLPSARSHTQYRYLGCLIAPWVIAALNVVGDTHVAATVAFGYGVPCFAGGLYDFPDLLVRGAEGGRQFNVGDAFFGDIDGFLGGLLFGIGWRASLLGVRS